MAETEAKVPETNPTSSGANEKISKPHVDLPKEPVAGLDLSSFGLPTEQYGGIDLSAFGLPTEEYGGIDVASMLASGPIMPPTAQSDGIPVKNTFIQFPENQHPSLVEYFIPRQSRSCPTSALMEAGHVPEIPETPTSGVSAPPGLEELIPTPPLSGTVVPKPPVAGASQIPIAGLPMPQLSRPSSGIEESPKNPPPGLEGMATPSSGLSASASPKANRPKAAKESPKVPPPGLVGPKMVAVSAPYPVPYPVSALSDPRYILPQTVSLAQAATLAQDRRPSKEQDLDEEKQVVRLAEGLGMTSLGSKDHGTGRCRPCGFLYKDANGCQNGADCPFCHMCPPGEIKRRKKEKTQWRRMVARQDNTAVLNKHQQVQ